MPDKNPLSKSGGASGYWGPTNYYGPTKEPVDPLKSTVFDDLQQLYDSDTFAGLKPHQQQWALATVLPNLALHSPEQFQTFMDQRFPKKRPSTFWENARTAVGGIPENVLGGGVGAATYAVTAAGTKSPVTAAAAGTAVAGVAGAAGAGYSRLIRGLREKLGLPEQFDAMEGYMLGGPPGAIAYEMARLTAPDETYSPARIKEKEPPLGESMKEAAARQMIAEAAGHGASAVIRGATRIFQGTPLTQLNLAGRTAEDIGDVTMLPSTGVIKDTGASALEGLAGLGVGGKEALAKAVKKSGERVSARLTTIWNRVGPKLAPDDAGILFKTAIKEEEEVLTKKGKALYDRIRELTDTYSKRVTTWKRQVTDARGLNLRGKKVVSFVPVKSVKNAVDIRPLKKLFQSDVLDAREGILATSMSGEESSTLIEFALNMKKNDDKIPYNTAALLLSDMLVALRSKTTPDFLRKLQGEAVGLLKADLGRVAKLGGTEAIALHNEAKALWAAKEELYGSKILMSMAKQNPEFVANLIWKPNNITDARLAMKAAGGFNSEGWKAMRRYGFENRFRVANVSDNPEKAIAKWWGLMGPEMRQLIAGPNAKEISAVISVMEAGQFTKVARELLAASTTAQLIERTAMSRLAYGMGSIGAGTAIGMQQGWFLGAAGAVLLLTAPKAAAELLLSKRGIALWMEGLTKKYRARDIGTFVTRALLLNQSLNQKNRRIKPLSPNRRIEPLPPKNPLAGISIDPIPTPMLGGR